MPKREILLVLDEEDWDTIQSEFARRQASRIYDGEGGTQPNLPEGESNDAGAMVAEMVRDLEEYRSLHET